MMEFDIILNGTHIHTFSPFTYNQFYSCCYSSHITGVPLLIPELFLRNTHICIYMLQKQTLFGIGLILVQEKTYIHTLVNLSFSLGNSI